MGAPPRFLGGAPSVAKPAAPSTMIPAGLSFFFRNAGQLLTLSGPPIPRRGPDLGELGILRDGAVLTRGPIIVGVGRTRGLEADARRLRARAIDCRGRVVMPGFVDSHTHLVFAGSRVDDFEERLRGSTYEEIASSGGGIALSARLLGEASTRELRAQALHFLEQLAAHGTTTVEVKTGYGLSVANEMKNLRAIERLRKQSPLEIVPTLLAAHAVPAQYRKRPRAYVDMVARRLLPAVAKNRLAEFIDCFCERVAFSVADCHRVLAAGVPPGLIPRLHPQQLSRT